jgi:hypothetical protein
MERSEDVRNRSAEEDVMTAFRARRWEPERESSRWALAVVVVAGLLGLAGWGLMGMEPSDHAVAGDSPAVVEAVEEPIARTVTIDPVESPVTAPVRDSAPGVIGIYECRQDGQKILSDRPCGPDAVQRLIDTRELSTFTETRQVTVGGAPSAAPVARSPRPAAGGGSGPRTGAEKAGLCQTLQARIDVINARTRQKHTHREGEYWRAKWHEAKNAYYDAGCGRP